MQLGELQGLLGVVIMTFSGLFSWCLYPENPWKMDMGAMGNTALVWHRGKLLALMEGGFPFLMKLCAGAVKTISEVTFGGKLTHNFTAHPKVDPKTGEMLSFAYKYASLFLGTCMGYEHQSWCSILMHGVHACRTGQRLCEKGEEDAHVVYFSVDASGNKSKSYPVDVQAAQIMHDFAVTENYAVFLDHALVLDVKHMVKEKSLPFKCALHNTSP